MNHIGSLRHAIVESRFSDLSMLHAQFHAEMMDFQGYSLPYQYKAGVNAEHHYCRTKACFFDVSHLTKQLLLIGNDVAERLELLIPSAIQELKAGKARYTVLTNESGGIRDDLVLCHAGDHYYMLLNTAFHTHNVEYLRAQLHGIEVIELSDQALFDIQGPSAEGVLATLCPEARELKFMSTQQVTLNGAVCRLSRLGFTGEDGFELSVPASHAYDIANAILAHDDVQPAGLGARESLRLEAGFNLYGNEIDARTSPIEAQIPWIIQKRRIQEANFFGAKRILEELKQGPSRKLVGLMPEGQKPVPSGCDIFSQDEKKIGKITSSLFGPTIGAPIANGYILSKYADIGADVLLNIDDNLKSARISKRPFVTRRYKRS
ncbi:MAG: glycine cleavage system aminomethyltransferase GcvT [Pseudomonadota bacterium]